PPPFPYTTLFRSAELTVSPQYGTPVGTDADPAVKGFQVVADASGAFSFQVQRPTGAGPSLLTVTDVTGASGTGVVAPTGPVSGGPVGYSAGYALPNPYSQAFTLPTARRIDFGPAGGTVAAGYIGVGSDAY